MNTDADASTEAVGRLVALYRGATTAEVQYGLTWYGEAHAWARDLGARHEVPVCRIAGVIAALSPQTTWPMNKRRTVEMVTRGDTSGFTLGRDKARRILDGEDPAEVLNTGRGPKSLAFYDNVWRPLTSTAVTIDRHAFDAAVGMVTDDTTRRRILERKGGYDHVADLYRRAAAEVQLRPHVLQAVVWSTWRNRFGLYRWQRVDSEFLDAYATDDMVRSARELNPGLGPAPRDF